MRPQGNLRSRTAGAVESHGSCATVRVIMAPAAFVDETGEAAKRLGDAPYDFAKEVDWNNGIFCRC